jgi:uncharacterized protein
MEPEILPSTRGELSATAAEEKMLRRLRWMFIGNQGLRAGWSALAFEILDLAFYLIPGFFLIKFHLITMQWVQGFTASSAFIVELVLFLAMVGAASLIALIERRRSIMEYNLTGPRRIPHFISGLAAGFVALSALMGALAWGGWVQFGPAALSSAAIFEFGALWAGTFLLVGLVEEGIFRCFLQATLTRGINFWWALGTVGAVCLGMMLTGKGNGVSALYGFALLGLIPCLLLHLKKSKSAGFWQAAWVTTTLFGFGHVFNPGESWVGISQVEFIGFIFCVSIRLTGSAWWAIGCHAAWDWAETFFYGTADSGRVGTGHFLTTSPAGNVLLSGGEAGPEGSLLVLGIMALLLVALIVLYGRRKHATITPTQDQITG